MPENFEEMAAHHAAMVRFAVQQLAPAALDAVGEEGLGQRLRDSDLTNAESVHEVTREAEATLRTRLRELSESLYPEGVPLGSAKDLPAEWHEMQAAMRSMTDAGWLLKDWHRSLERGQGHRFDDDRRYDWRKAQQRLREITREVAHLCDGPVGYRARLLAANVTWPDVDAHAGSYDDDTLERACRLAEVAAFEYTPAKVVFDGAAAIGDEACDVACLAMRGFGLWTTTVLDAATRLPLWQFSGAQWMYTAAVDHMLQGRNRPTSREGLFREALAAVDTLDESGCDLAARLVQGGMTIGEAATTARAAMAVPA